MDLSSTFLSKFERTLKAEGLRSYLEYSVLSILLYERLLDTQLLFENVTATRIVAKLQLGLEGMAEQYFQLSGCGLGSGFRFCSEFLNFLNLVFSWYFPAASF